MWQRMKTWNNLVKHNHAGCVVQHRDFAPISSQPNKSPQQRVCTQWQPDIILLCNATRPRHTACNCTSSAGALNWALWSPRT